MCVGGRIRDDVVALLTGGTSMTLHRLTNIDHTVNKCRDITINWIIVSLHDSAIHDCVGFQVAESIA